jgi:alpha-beta hydrolase superfamily lysophospholipase
VWLDGIVVEPRGRRRRAVLWIHGLGSSFASGQPLTRELSARFIAEGIAYFKFNTRGHDPVSRAGGRLAGAAFEPFTRCVEDIRAMIGLAARRGYAEIVLAGHSTGANKALHYMARTRDRRVRLLMLLGPIADIAGETARIGAGELSRRVARAERIAARAPDALVPREWGLWSARRYLSLYRSGGAEDVFPYYRAGARWTALGRVRVPLAIVLGERDEFLDRPALDVVRAFERHATGTRAFTGTVIPRAGHGFQGRERALADAMLDIVTRRRQGAKRDRGV